MVREKENKIGKKPVSLSLSLLSLSLRRVQSVDFCVRVWTCCVTTSWTYFVGDSFICFVAFDPLCLSILGLGASDEMDGIGRIWTPAMEWKKVPCVTNTREQDKPELQSPIYC